jgi:sigma-B regulation protein RsbU (phosphoserine phosphatase)
MMLLGDGEVVDVMENGLVLGLLRDVPYTCLELGLRAGDRLVLYADGLVEASNAQEEMFGEERLKAVIAEKGGKPAAQAAEWMLARLKAWARVQEDDLTVLICEYEGYKA